MPWLFLCWFLKCFRIASFRRHPAVLCCQVQGQDTVSFMLYQQFSNAMCVDSRRTSAMTAALLVSLTDAGFWEVILWCRSNHWADCLAEISQIGFPVSPSCNTRIWLLVASCSIKTCLPLLCYFMPHWSVVISPRVSGLAIWCGIFFGEDCRNLGTSQLRGTWLERKLSPCKTFNANTFSRVLVCSVMIMKLEFVGFPQT